MSADAESSDSGSQHHHAVDADARGYSTGRPVANGRTNIVFAALTLGAIAFTVLQSLVIPALPVIQEALGTDQATSAWVLTGYLLSASVATPILGRLGDMFGKKKMLVLIMGALAGGSVLGALSTSIGMLIVARLIQGLSGAIFPLAFGIIRDEFPARRLPGAIGIMSAMLGIGSGVGTVVAGPLIDALSWRWLFWAPMIIALLAMAVAAVFIPESKVRAPGRVNLPAAIALSGWLVALLLGLNKGASWGWFATPTLGLFALAVVLFVVWTQIETRSAEPLIDLRMMRIPAVWRTNVVALLLGSGMYASFAVIPAFLQAPESTGYGFGASVTRSGLYMLPATVSMVIVGLRIGRIIDRFGAKPPLVVGSALAVLPYLLLAFAHTQAWEFLVATLLQGFGVGLAFSSMSNLIMQAVPPTQTGAATGMNANIRTIGGSIGSQTVSSILASGTLIGGHFPRESSYSISFLVLAGAMIAAVFAATLVPVGGLRHRRNRSGRPIAVPAARAETGRDAGRDVGTEVAPGMGAVPRGSSATATRTPTVTTTVLPGRGAPFPVQG